MRSHSQYSLLHLCPERYNNVYNHRLLDGTGVEAVFSDALIHRPIVEWYGSKGGGYEPDWAACSEEFFSGLSVEPATGYSLVMAKNIFREYRGRFEGWQEEYEVVGTEAIAFTDIEGTSYGAVPDWVFRRRVTGELIPFDLKASKSDFAQDAFPHDRQHLGQVAVVPGATSFGRDFIQYDLRAGKAKVIDRSIVAVDPALLEEWRREVVVKERAYRLYQESGIWPMESPFACNAYGRPCPFLVLCSAPPEMRDGIREILPKKGEWVRPEKLEVE